MWTLLDILKTYTLKYPNSRPCICNVKMLTGAYSLVSYWQIKVRISSSQLSFSTPQPANFSLNFFSDSITSLNFNSPHVQYTTYQPNTRMSLVTTIPLSCQVYFFLRRPVPWVEPSSLWALWFFLLLNC